MNINPVSSPELTPDESSVAQFFTACSQSDVKVAELFLQKFPDLIKARDEEGRTAFFRAVSTSNFKMVKWLLEHGADPKIPTNKALLPFQLACRHGRKKIAKCILKHSPELLNSRGKEGDTSLSIAVKRNKEKTVAWLLEQGADTTIRDDDGNSPLHEACSNGRKEIAQCILKRSPELLNSRGKNGMTPLFQAAAQNHKEMVEWLLEQGADPTICDDDGDSPLHGACCNGYKETAQAIFKHSSQLLNSKGEDGETPLFAAVLGDHKEMVEWLLEQGADPAICDDDGDSPLHGACCNGYKETAQAIFKHSPQLLNSKGEDGKTPLFTAVLGNHKDIVEWLLEQGADTTICDDDGDSPLHGACCSGYKEIAQVILKHSPELLNRKGEDGETPLFAAVLGDHKEMVEWLLEQGADPAICDDDGDSPLHGACCNGYKEIAQVILKHSPELLNRKGEDGKTPLFTAVLGNHKDMVEWLLEQRADPKIHNESDDSPAAEACKEERRELFELLVPKYPEYTEVSEVCTKLIEVAKQPTELRKCVEKLVVSEDKRVYECVDTVFPGFRRCRKLASLLEQTRKGRVAAIVKHIQNAPHGKIAEAVHDEVAKFRPQYDALVCFIFAELYKPPKLDDLYMDKGVCIGSTLDYVSRRVNGVVTDHDIYPTTKARFYQAAHFVTITGYQESNPLWESYSSVFASLKNKPTKPPILHLQKTYECLLLATKQTGHYKLHNLYQEKLRTLSLQGAHIDLSNEQREANDALKKEHATILSMRKALQAVGIDDVFLKKMNIQVEVIEPKPHSVDYFINNFEHFANKIKAADGEYVIFTLDEQENAQASSEVVAGPIASALYKELAQITSIKVKGSLDRAVYAQEFIEKLAALPTKQLDKLLKQFREKRLSEVAQSLLQKENLKNSDKHSLEYYKQGLEALLEKIETMNEEISLPTKIESRTEKMIYGALGEIAGVLELPTKLSQFPEATLEKLFTLTKLERKRLVAAFKKEQMRPVMEKLVAAESRESVGEAVGMKQQKVKKEIEEILHAFIEGKQKSKEEESDLSHVIYTRWGPPYEIRDVADPDFVRFTTNDLEEFKLYFIFWSTFNTRYDCITEMSRVTKRYTE